MEFCKGKYNIECCPLDYMYSLIRFKFFWNLYEWCKAEEIFEGHRIRTYWYGPILIEVNEKL